MKSSPRVVSADKVQQLLKAWQPAELDAPQPVSWAMDVAALVDLFTPAPEDEPEVKKHKSVTRWSPEELSYMVFDPPPVKYVAPLVAEAQIPITPEPEPEPLAAEPGVYEATAAQIEAMLAQAQSQAHEILRNAQQAADEMLLEAQQEITAERTSGYEAGRAQAIEEAKSSLAALNEAANQVHEWKNDLMQQSEPLILQMLQEIARKLFGEGVVLSDHALQQNLNRVLENSGALGDIKIYLNPYDVNTLDPGWREMRTSITGERIQLIPTETVKRGGCFVNGQEGSIDARVESQLRSIFQAVENESQTHEEPA